jgi:hypothetical protein
MKIKLDGSHIYRLVGIWWYTENREFWDVTKPLKDGFYNGFAIHYSNNAEDNHSSLWKQVCDENDKSRYSKGYKSLERGKVFYDTQTKKFIVICSKKMAHSRNFIRDCIIHFNLLMKNTQFRALPDCRAELPDNSSEGIPHNDDVFEIVITGDLKDGILKELLGKISRHLYELDQNDIVKYWGFKSPPKDSIEKNYCLPFKVWTSNNYLWPQDVDESVENPRDFKVYITYKPKEKSDSPNFNSGEGVYIENGDDSDFDKAAQEAIDFIQGKIKVINDLYQTSRKTLWDVYSWRALL